MAQPQETILFVSMDGTGVKSSAIRAHAARKGHQKSRLNMAKQSPELADAQKKQTKAADAVTKSKARRKASGKPPATVSKAEAKKKAASTEEQSSQHENQMQLVTSTSTTTSTSPKKETPSPFQMWLPSCMSDRFVQMFFETMMPSYTAAYDAFNVPNIIKSEWPLYMNHEVFLWTEAAAIQGLYESLQNPEKPPSARVLQYKAKALSCLKKELMQTKNGQLDDYLVMSIFVLASLDLMAGDEIAHDAHKKILRTAFAAAGGLHTYGSFVRNTTMRLDSFWRSTSTEPTTPAVPLLLPSRSPQLPHHPFSPSLVDLIGLLPPGFQELALQRKLPLDILEVLGRIADPSQKPLPTLPSTNDNRSPTSTTQKSQYLDFWESCPSLSTTSRDANNEPPLERLLALALLIYSTNRDASNPLRMYNCITNGAIYDLCHDLPQCETRRTKDEEQCLFWVWSVTVDAMRDRFGTLTVQGEGLLDQQKKRFPGVVGTAVEERVLERFWFASDKSDGSCLFVQNPMFIRRSNTMQESVGPSSPGASGTGGLGRTESMDSWSVGTPRHEKDRDATWIRTGSTSSQVDETESVGRWHGPGFGLLPSGKGGDEAFELTYGKIGTVKNAPVKCIAG